MDTNSTNGGIALLCDTVGTIIEIVSDEEGLLSQAGTVTMLVDLVAPEDESTAHSLIEHVHRRGAAFNWEMQIRASQDQHRALFSGTRSEVGLHIMAVLPSRSPAAGGTTRVEQRRVNRNGNARGADRAHTFSALRPNLDEDLLQELTLLNNELVTTQRELAGKNAKLDLLNKEKNHFLGMAAHDLRSPLSEIIMLSYMLVDSTADEMGTANKEMVEQIRDSGEFMLGLINDFLDVASIESGALRLQKSEVDLPALVAKTVMTNRVPAGEKEIRIGLLCDEDIPATVLDPDKIEQVLNNLISNAIKYSPPGAKVDVHLRRRDYQVLITVSDTGQGIPAEQQHQLFKPFGLTSVRSTGGERSVGLGLHIVKQIVEGHGGTVLVESKSGEGSTFTVVLPIREA